MDGYRYSVYRMCAGGEKKSIVPLGYVLYKMYLKKNTNTRTLKLLKLGWFLRDAQTRFESLNIQFNLVAFN